MANAGLSVPTARRKLHPIKKTLTQHHPLTVHTHGFVNFDDGFCRWSWIAFDASGKIVARDSGLRGNGYGSSSNAAKFHAVIEALGWIAVNMPDTPITVLCDLELAVDALYGQKEVHKQHLKLLLTTAQQFLSRTEAELVWIPHEQNKAA